MPPRKKKTEGTRAANGESSIYLGADGRWHGRVTVGIKDDGSEDRRHVSSKDEKVVKDKVKKLERARDDGNVRKSGPSWTVEKWLRHWVENISAPTVRDNTADGYRNAVYNHLIPGLGKHRLERIQPEHFEKLYKKMTDAGHKASNAHQVHRTARTAFNEALARGHITKNPVQLAKPPRVEEIEIEPYEVEEAQRILAAAAGRRNAARWAVALVLGLRQGEALGLKWDDVDLDALDLRVRRNRLRPKYVHGCGDKPCGRKAGYCPQKVNKRKECAETKSRSGKRPMGIPSQLGELLRQQKDAQEKERAAAGDLWVAKGYIFAQPTGEPLNPNTDFREWKELLKLAGVREGRLHDARHTAATILLGLHVADRTAQGLMGWADPSMPGRYQHVVKRIRDDVAERQGAVFWGSDTPEAESSDATETAPEGQGKRAY